MPAILKLSSSIIRKYHVLFVFVADNARLRIGELAAARQCPLQECTVTPNPNDTTTNDAAAFLHRCPSRTIEPIPELLNVGVGVAPSANKRLNFIISKTIGLKLAPSSQSAGIAES